MTIDEAIKHAKDKAKEQRKDYDTCVVKEGYGCKDCAYYYSKSCIECAEEHEQLAEWLEELKEYKELEEQGLLLKLPFPLGTKKLYLIDGYEIDEIDATGITLYKANENAIRPHETVICVDYCDFYYDDFGKTVFLTKEEAEKALERLECAE